MHVLMVVAELGSGGAEAVVTELARDAVARGTSVTVASSGGWRGAELHRAGVRLLAVPLAGRRPLRLLRAARVLRRELRARDHALIHAHNVKAAAAVRLATLGLRRRPRVLVTLHGIPDASYRLAARLLARCADRVVGVSRDVAERLAGAGLPTTRIAVIENAISPVAKQPRSEARARLGLPLDIPVALCIARLVPSKRHDLLVDAWRHLPGDAVLLIAGDGTTRAAVAAAARVAGVAGRIRLLGERRDIDWLLAAADVCVLATESEGLPISLLEAMTVGVPVVASAVGGLPGALGDAAHLVEPGSPDALAGALRELFADPQRRAALGAAGAELARTRFGRHRMLDAYRATYETVGNNVGGARS